MKDSIILQGRTYECTKLVQQRFGLDDQTLRKWAKNNIVPSPVRLGTSVFMIGKPLKVKYWRLVRTELQKETPRCQGAGKSAYFETIDGSNKQETSEYRSLDVK